MGSLLIVLAVILAIAFAVVFKNINSASDAIKFTGGGAEKSLLPKNIIKEVTAGINAAPPCIKREFAKNIPRMRKHNVGGVVLYSVDDENTTQLIHRIKLMQKMIPNGWPNNYHIYYLGSKQKKYFKHGMQGRDEVNGGLTFTSPPVVSYVYRAEEAPRVLVHEILHAVDNPVGAVGNYENVKLYEGAVDAVATAIECEIKGESLSHAVHRAEKLVRILLSLGNNCTYSEYMKTRQSANTREYYLLRWRVLCMMVAERITPEIMLSMDRKSLRKKIIDCYREDISVDGTSVDDPDTPNELSAVRL